MSNSNQKIRIFTKSYLQVAGILTLILLAVLMMWFNNLNSTQAISATVAQVRFYGEYRIGDTYDMYDMVEIARLKAGDILVRHSGEVQVISKEQDETGTVFINGGLGNGGFDLVTDDCGIFYESGADGIKNWYEIGEATIRVSADFRGLDKADPERGEVILYPGDFLVGAVTNYDFTPYNTTIRVEGGQIVEMNRT